MVLRVQPNRDWDDLDFKLLEAYQIMQDEQCPQCGHPIWLCRSSSNDIEWTVESSICYASKRLEEHRESKKGSKATKATADERAEWGVSRYANPRVIQPRAEKGATMPTRTDFYESDAR